MGEGEEGEVETDRKRTDLDWVWRSMQRQASTVDEDHFIDPMMQLAKE